MSAPKCQFIFYNVFFTVENFYKQKHFLKTRSTCFVYHFSLKFIIKQLFCRCTLPLIRKDISLWNLIYFYLNCLTLHFHGPMELLVISKIYPSAGQCYNVLHPFKNRVILQL